MKNGELSSSTAIKMAITPGEEVQNLLARYGLASRVQDRNYTNPEPPPGLWTKVNGAIALFGLGGVISILGWATFQIAPSVLETISGL